MFPNVFQSVSYVCPNTTRDQPKHIQLSVNVPNLHIQRVFVWSLIQMFVSVMVFKLYLFSALPGIRVVSHLAIMHQANNQKLSSSAKLSIFFLSVSNQTIVSPARNFTSGTYPVSYLFDSLLIPSVLMCSYSFPSAPNPCGDNDGRGPCSHLCLINYNRTSSCTCPHLMKLSANKQSCFG